MQQQVIIVGGGMVGLSLSLMLAKANIAVKLLEAVKYPNYDDQNVAPYHSSFDVRNTAYRVVASRFIRSWGYGMHYSSTRLQFYKFTLLNKAVLVRHD